MCACGSTSVIVGAVWRSELIAPPVLHFADDRGHSDGQRAGRRQWWKRMARAAARPVGRSAARIREDESVLTGSCRAETQKITSIIYKVHKIYMRISPSWTGAGTALADWMRKAGRLHPFARALFRPTKYQISITKLFRIKLRCPILYFDGTASFSDWTRRPVFPCRSWSVAATTRLRDTARKTNACRWRCWYCRYA